MAQRYRQKQDVPLSHRRRFLQCGPVVHAVSACTAEPLGEFQQFGERMVFGLPDLSQIWTGLNGYAETGGDETGRGGAGGGEASAGQLVSPRPSELTTIEVDVLRALAKCGDYTTFSPTTFTMKRGRAERDYTPAMLQELCKKVKDPTVNHTARCKRPRIRKGCLQETFIPKKIDMLTDLHKWLFRRPSMAADKWVGLQGGAQTTILELFKEHARRAPASSPPPPRVDDAGMEDNGGDDGFQGADADDLSTPAADLHPPGPVDGQDPASDVDDSDEEHIHIEGGIDLSTGAEGDSDTGSEVQGSPTQQEEQEDVEIHLPEDDVVGAELESYALPNAEEVAQLRGFFGTLPPKMKPAILRRLAYLARCATQGPHHAQFVALMNDLKSGRLSDRVISLGIPGNYSLWARLRSPDQPEWSRHGWLPATNQDGWMPPSDDPVDGGNEPNLSQAAPQGIHALKWYVTEFAKMFTPEMLSILRERTNLQLHYERTRWAEHVNWAKEQERHRNEATYEPATQYRPWTYTTSDGRTLPARPPPRYIYECEEGEYTFAPVTQDEILKYVGLLLACAARSGDAGLSTLQDSPLSLLSWGGRGGVKSVLPRRRRQGVSYLLSGHDVYARSALGRHEDATGCSTATKTWRFAELYDAFNRACIRLIPPGTRWLSYDESRWGYTGRLPAGMRQPALHKAQGEGFDEIVLSSSTGYRIYGEIDFGKSKWARGDPLAASPNGGVPIDQRIVRIMRIVRSHLPSWPHVFSDNKFTKLSVIRTLYRNEIFWTGTTKRIVGNYGAPDAIIAFNGNPGDSLTVTDVAIKDSQVSCIAWRDAEENKNVVLMSSFFCGDDEGHVKRWHQHERVTRAAPGAIPSYNKRMGGVDVHSQLASGTMSCRQRTRRWPLSAFFMALDSMRANAFLLVSETARANGWPRVDHRCFTAALAHAFCGVSTQRESAADLTQHLRRIYGLDTYGPQESAIPQEEPRSTGEQHPHNMRRLLLRVANPERLRGISEAITLGHIHWPKPLPASKIVAGVEYPRGCAACRSPARLVCSICRLQLCWGCYPIVHRQTSQLGEQAAQTHRVSLLDAYRRPTSSPPTVPLHLRGEEGELNE